MKAIKRPLFLVDVEDMTDCLFTEAYRVADDQVEFLRVKHGMMHLPGLFESQHPPA